MTFRHTIKTSFTGLTTHRSRSMLTILGIVIGITAIILVVSLGDSAQGVIVGELGGLGAETIVIRPGREPRGPSDFAQVLFADSIKTREYEALRNKANVPDIVDGSPEVIIAGAVSYGGETFTPTAIGISARFMAGTFGLELAEGDVFSDSDIASKSRVAVIGSEVKKELFGDDTAVGKSFELKGAKFRVVGVFAEKGQVVFFNVDNLVLIPYTSAQAYVTGTKHYNQIIVKASSGDAVERTVADIKATLRELHGIEDPEDDDFNVETQQGIVEQISTIIGTFTLFLSVVVAISLVVGGIGIMNIMLVSVTERTREIGLRKALGATDTDILQQFLYEAVMLTGAGGLIGIFFGTVLALGASFGLSQYLDIPFTFSFPFQGAFLGVIVSGLVGVVFGLYPARQASKKSPIEALRYE